jgi:hypothetical protein
MLAHITLTSRRRAALKTGLRLALILECLSLIAAARAQLPGIKFDQGIGYYYYAGGKLEVLPKPTRQQDWGSPFCTLMLPQDVRFFTYGLDFSRGLAGEPGAPCQFGFDFTYSLPGGRMVDASWPARFVPVAGYDEKVYEIVFDGPIDHLKSGDLKCSYCVFRLGGATRKEGHEEGFCFRFIHPREE